MEKNHFFNSSRDISGSLWDFAVQVYATPEVEQQSLELQDQYNANINIILWCCWLEIEEIHHTEKQDAPSGTAISLAEGVKSQNPSKKDWTNEKTTDQTKIGIISKRELNVPGTHIVKYASDLEQIEIKHTAFDRSVFAQGALSVAEWIVGKKGFLSFSDYLNDHN